MKTVERARTWYRCEYCGKEYLHEEDAAICEEYGSILKQLKSIEPYNWVLVDTTLDNQERRLFVNHITNDQPFDCCISNTIKLCDASSNCYYEVKCYKGARNEQIKPTYVKSLSIEEAFEKDHSFLPVIASFNWDDTPEDIQQRVMKIYDKFNKLLRAKVDSLSTKELADMVYSRYEVDLKNIKYENMFSYKSSIEWLLGNKLPENKLVNPNKLFYATVNPYHFPERI